MNTFLELKFVLFPQQTTKTTTEQTKLLITCDDVGRSKV